MTFGKRQLLVGALVVALGAAVYLNWQFSAVQPEPVTETAASDTKELGQTVYVNTELSGQTAKKTDTDKAKEADKQTSDTDKKTAAKETAAQVSTSTEQQDYFTLERQHRQTARDDAIAALTEMLEAADSSENARKEATAAVEKLSAVIKAESDMEAEIKTKGFADCLVSVNNDNCTVIVPAEGLNEATAVTIKDIVNRQAGIDFDKITITGR
ncbi:MAG: SpoIIIAH-like family protein [Clostridia bacterium]|nr:SpoIIIAH-like family protein [Clostridia bacterium]